MGIWNSAHSPCAGSAGQRRRSATHPLRQGVRPLCVLLASANEFTTDVTGRASFYVGGTRAIEYLEVFAYENKGLASEMEAVLARIKD